MQEQSFCSFVMTVLVHVGFARKCIELPTRQQLPVDNLLKKQLYFINKNGWESRGNIALMRVVSWRIVNNCDCSFDFNLNSTKRRTPLRRWFFLTPAIYTYKSLVNGKAS